MTGSPVPSGRGSEHAKGAARRALILHTAGEVLAADGVQGFSLRKVAQASGIRLGNLQYYFPTGRDLVESLLEAHLTAGLARLTDVADDPDAMLDALLAEHADRSLVAGFLAIWELAAHDQATAAALSEFYDRYTAIVAAEIHRRCPQLPLTTATARARVAVMLLEGAAVLRSGVGGEPDTESDAQLRTAVARLLGADEDR
ncbi:MAG: TetR family transcriptional regulator [Cellulomonadaceae bacterium]|nr:TetR family transcriptional regulator [Cellulomonadaceae bacterium]